MAVSTELEELVVRLTGDGSQYRQMLEQARADTNSAASGVETATSRIEALRSTLGSFAGVAMQSLGVLGAGAWINSAMSAFGEAQGAERRLRTSLRINGREVNRLMEDYRAFATEVQRVTTTEDDAAIAMLGQAESLGVTGDAAKRAVRNSIAAAAAYPQMFGSAESALRQMVGLEQGHAQMLARLIPELRGIENPTLQAARAQEIMARNWEFATEEAKTLGGQIQQLKNAYGDFMEEIGGVISLFVKPVKSWLVDVAKDAVKWLQSLSKEAKIAIAGAAAIVTGLLAIGPAMAVWGAIGAPILATITGGLALIPTLFGPIGIGIGLVVIAATVLINKLGGLEAAWNAVKRGAGIAMDWAKTKFQQFMTWAGPTFNALSDLADTAWNAITEGVTYAWETTRDVFMQGYEFVRGVWRDIVGDTEADWDEIARIINTTIIGAQWVILNFRQAFELAWAGMKYYAVATANFLLRNVFTIITGAQLIPGLLAMSVNWSRVWDFIANTAREAGRYIASNWRELLQLMTDPTYLFRNGLSRIFGDSFTNGITLSLEGINLPELTRLEGQLREEFERLGRAAGESFGEFRDRRLLEIQRARGGGPERAAEAAGSAIGGAFNRGAEKEMEKFDAVLKNSAEALSRISAYQERLRQTNPTTGASRGTPGSSGGVALTPSPSPTGGVGGTPASPSIAPGVTPSSTAPANANQMNDLLVIARAMAGYLGAMARSSAPTTLDPVNLEGDWGPGE